MGPSTVSEFHTALGQYLDYTVALSERLVERGVPREDIVLAFHPPYVRKHTAYAVG